MAADQVEVEVGDRTVRISNPGRVYFPARGETKLDLVRYYLSRRRRHRAGAARAAVHAAPFPDRGRRARRCTRSGSRAARRRGWKRCGCHFPRFGRHADELCVTELAAVVWAVQMSTVEFHPWNSRRADVERPDEWRIDMDPDARLRVRHRVRRVAHIAQEMLDELGAIGWPKTSGGNGLHMYVRISPRCGFAELRRAALAFARELERRVPDDATTVWWRKDRDPAKVFVDYNQNARDHTIACAYSVRGVPEAHRLDPIAWDEIDDVEPGELTIATVPARFAELGDLHAGIDDAAYSLDALLEWADRDGLD